MATSNKSLKDLPQLPVALVEQLASFVKTEQDLSLITNQLMKQVVERALQAELSHDLEVESAAGNANSRNGFMGKTLKGHFGEMLIQTPRDRAGAFEPTLVRKGQTRFTAFDDQILSLYARGMSTRDIVPTCSKRCTVLRSRIRSSPKPLKRCWTRLMPGNAAAWMRSIPLCIWIASSLKSIRTNASLTKLFTWHWV
jgi:hypothetical protein